MTREEQHARHEEMRAYKAEGHKNREVAERFGVSIASASKICKGISGFVARNDAMQKYKAEGHSLAEVAEHFGASKELVQKVCKGIAPQTMRRPLQYRNQWSGKDQTGRVKNVIAERTPGFEFAGNYTGSDGTVDLKCKACGHVQTRSWISVKQSSVACDACREMRLKEQQEKQGQKRQTIEETRKQRAEAIAWSLYEKSIKQQTFAICKECSTLFIQTARKEAYCSDECRRRANNNRKDRRLKGVSQDASITLRKVYEKAAGVCYLCGGMCDWDDIETRDDGTMVAGNRYPSIDHVYPISLGGTHTWDNVRLAHRWCNAVKNDNPLSQKPAI